MSRQSNDNNDKTKEEYITNIRTMAWLENTRMLFDFMQALSARCYDELRNHCSDELSDRYSDDKKQWKYTGYNGDGGLEKRNKICEETNEKVKGILNEIPKDGDNNYSRLNPLWDYLKFYKMLFEVEANDNNEKTYKSISRCLQYFNTLRYLLEDSNSTDSELLAKHDELPYLYEDLCFSIREISECFAVYIVYSEEGVNSKIISRSGYIIKNKQPDEPSDESEIDYFRSEKADDIIQKYHKSDEVKVITKGIHIINEEKYLVVRLPISSVDNNSNRSFYILLDYQNSEDSNIENFQDMCTKSAYKVLFLRYRLSEALERDYAKLLGFRFDCSYIHSVNKPGEDKRSEDFPLILHISDLHLDTINTQRYIEDFNKILKPDSETRKCDLIAITGDIVNGSYSASDAQEKYKCAEEFIFSIVKTLWGVKDNYFKKSIEITEKKQIKTVTILPHDWKRRILIIPGNHDYTTMSDVVVEAKARRIKAAFPATQSAKTMSKLTYYIEFLADFLDVPIKEIVENDMNEIRFYRNFKLKVGLFNTVANSNSLQNNKVGFSNETILKSLISTNRWKDDDREKNYHIVLMHHGPKYKINYFDDKYSWWEYKALDDNSKQLCKDYIETIVNAYYSSDKIPVRINSIVGASKNAKFFTKLDKFIDSFENSIKFKDVLTNDDKKLFRESEIYADIKRILKLYKSHTNPKIGNNTILKDEYDYEFWSKQFDLVAIQKYDQKLFKESCELVLNEFPCTVLAGHEHSKKDYYYKVNNKQVKVFVSDKWRKSDSYSILKYNNENGEYYIIK